MFSRDGRRSSETCLDFCQDWHVAVVQWPSIGGANDVQVEEAHNVGGNLPCTVGDSSCECQSCCQFPFCAFRSRRCLLRPVRSFTICGKRWNNRYLSSQER